MSEELKPCPHCGGEARYTGYASCDCCNKPFNASVSCLTCGAKVDHLDTKEEATAAWNTRAPQPAASGDREALVELIEDALNSVHDMDVTLKAYANSAADALIAAGMVNRPEAVVHEDALRQTLADLAHAEAPIAARDAEIARLREVLSGAASAIAMMINPEAIASTTVVVAWAAAVEAEAKARAALKETEHD